MACPAQPSSSGLIRILHVVYSLDPGGMENGIVNLTRALDPAAFEVHVCCLERRGAFADRLPPGVTVTELSRKPGFSWDTVLRLRREIRRLRPHLLHSHNLGPLLYSGLASLGGITAPIVQGEHAELTAEELTPRRLRMRHLLYRSCHTVHSVSLGLHQQLQELGFPPAKLRPIINGVDTGKFTPPSPETRRQARHIAGVPEEATVIGIVGRFGPFKRHALLIRAFEAIADRHPGLHLLVVGGGGPMEPHVRELAAASRHAQRITLTGFQQDPRPYYHALDLLAVPSVNEGLSNAVLEAMACGVPVLGHFACGNAEVITSARDGILADLSHEAGLREALEPLVTGKQTLSALGSAARDRVTSHFSLAKMVHDYETLYRSAAKPQATPCC
jgi:glycosyltransferase involved in cell wall biosynthesis